MNIIQVFILVQCKGTVRFEYCPKPITVLLAGL